jgi:hypothetical protein
MPITRCGTFSTKGMIALGVISWESIHSIDNPTLIDFFLLSNKPWKPTFPNLGMEVGVTRYLLHAHPKNIYKYLLIKEETNILGNVFSQRTSPHLPTYLPTYVPTSFCLPSKLLAITLTHMLTCPPTYLNQPTISPPLA